MPQDLTTPNADTPDAETVEQVREVMGKIDIAMVTTIEAAPPTRLVSRPLTTKLAENGDALFLVRKSSPVAAEVLANPQVNLAYTSKTTWLSVSGVATIVEDRELVEELWSPAAGAFMDGGPENPDNVVLRVTGETAQLWGGDGLLGTVTSLVRAITGRKGDDEGTNTVDLR